MQKLFTHTNMFLFLDLMILVLFETHVLLQELASFFVVIVLNTQSNSLFNLLLLPYITFMYNLANIHFGTIHITNLLCNINTLSLQYTSGNVMLSLSYPSVYPCGIYAQPLRIRSSKNPSHTELWRYASGGVDGATTPSDLQSELLHLPQSG